MNKIAVSLFGWLEDHKNQISDLFWILLMVLFGTFVKVYKEPNKPHKWRFTRLLAEVLISFLIAFTFYQINSNWLHLPRLFVMTLCVWCGSMSDRIYSEVDAFLTAVFEALKAFIKNKFSVILLLFSLSFFALSCASKKVVKNTTTLETKEKNDTIKQREVIKNLAVVDTLKIPIEKVTTPKADCDSITNEKINEILSRLNIKKTSGENAYGFYYDKLKRELIAYATIGATQNEKIVNQYHNQKTIVEKQITQVPVKYIPKLVLYGAIFGVLMLLYNLIKLYLWLTRKSLPLG